MKHLTLITKGRNTWQTLSEQLAALLGNHVTISGYHLGSALPDRLQGDLVLLSSNELLPHVRNLIPASCPVLITRRSINYHEVEKLFDIPDGSDVLLVNDDMSTARETISLLLALGIDHVRYHPYAPGLRDYPQLKLAVTPGEPDCAPPCVERIIDIHSRTVDITTLVEIADKLALLDANANILSANYMRDVIRLIKTNKQNATISHILNNKLHAVINTVHDGIIAIDENQAISVINPVAEELLSLPAEQVTGQKIDAALNSQLEKFLTQLSPQQEENFISYNNRQLVANAAAIGNNEKPSGFIYTFKDVSEIQRLEEELRRKTVREQQVARYTLSQIIGNSKPIQSAIEKATCLAASDSPILIQGESGTGKELLAQGIHNASARRHGPFIAINFAALSETLLESELFGYEEGSFTGARKGGAAGLFEQAHKGTLFLDEIGDSPLTFQVRILRVLQEKQVRRIGSTRNIPIDVRVISATNQNVKDLVARGLFRQDLYYRLNVLPLALPSLKERKEDILALATHYYERFKPAADKQNAADYFQHVAPYFLAYDWPGNIRELQNVVEYLVNICPSVPPKADLLNDELRHYDLLLRNVRQNNPSQTTERTLHEKVLEEIARCNQQGISVGRRSLAHMLQVPESNIRKTILQLKATGQIEICKGRKGLLLI
ncbi:sigma-54 interaction domain-containing protein [Azotosporobacter soli]|uniref:sigma-54 interaction domain-containing protein n=1 Tax=Azotosporobacter soli TaxID=3055040 RepID=UPI0031FEC119